MELAQLFAAPPGRRRFALWGALLEALDDATFGIGETSVAQAKLAWWSEELQQGATSLHPLLRELFGDSVVAAVDAARWRALGHAASRLAGDDRTPADVDAALARVAAYAAAVVAIEQHLFDVPGGDPVAVGIECAARPLLGRSARGGWPMQLLARHQVAPDAASAAQPAAAERALRRDFADELRRRLPPPQGPWFRRSRTLLLADELRGLVAGAGRAGFGHRIARLTRLWREARRGRH
jgi:phytoene synthase